MLYQLGSSIYLFIILQVFIPSIYIPPPQHSRNSRQPKAVISTFYCDEVHAQMEHLQTKSLSSGFASLVEAVQFSHWSWGTMELVVLTLPNGNGPGWSQLENRFGYGWMWFLGRSSQWVFLIYLVLFSLRLQTSTEIRWLPMLATTLDWRDLHFDGWNACGSTKLAASEHNSRYFALCENEPVARVRFNCLQAHCRTVHWRGNTQLCMLLSIVSGHDSALWKTSSEGWYGGGDWSFSKLEGLRGIQDGLSLSGFIIRVKSLNIVVSIFKSRISPETQGQGCIEDFPSVNHLSHSSQD